jgi:chromosomal replication initiation ATPase DnaA
MNINQIIAHTVIYFVCKAYGIYPFQIKWATRGERNWSDARHSAMVLIKKYCPELKNSEIAALFNRPNPCIVVYAQKNVGKLLWANDEFFSLHKECNNCLKEVLN